MNASHSVGSSVYYLVGGVSLHFLLVGTRYDAYCSYV
jgi:hypothetical protein